MIRKSHGVALAALALAASGAFAQSSVKIYGLLDVSFGSYKPAYVEIAGQKIAANGQPVATPSVNSGQMTTSFIGFSGSEDLGGGLKAEFALESFLAADTGGTLNNNGGGFWGRASWVGLSGSFGKVTIGQYDNPLFTFGYTYDPFGSSMAFSPTMRHYNYIGQTGYGTGFDTGWVNSITYETPNLSGFTGVAQYAFKETTLNDAKNGFTLAGFYNAGPLSLSAVYVQGALSNSPVGSWLQDDKVFAFGGSYDFGAAKLFATYSQVKATKGLATSTSIVDFGGSVKDKIWQLGVSIPAGPGSVLASYGQAKVKQDGFDGSVTDKVFSLAYDYNLSKRTDAYVVYSNNKQTDLEGGNSFVVGIRHNF
ncbi:MAG: porin [Aquabacterium sp.]|nr:MAG: porin [Aquabacterium sp.]